MHNGDRNTKTGKGRIKGGNSGGTQGLREDVWRFRNVGHRAFTGRVRSAWRKTGKKTVWRLGVRKTGTTKCRILTGMRGRSGKGSTVQIPRVLNEIKLTATDCRHV